MYACYMFVSLHYQPSHLEPRADLVEDQRTTAFSLLELSVSVITEHCVMVRPAFSPSYASSELQPLHLRFLQALKSQQGQRSQVLWHQIKCQLDQRRRGLQELWRQAEIQKLELEKELELTLPQTSGQDASK